MGSKIGGSEMGMRPRVGRGRQSGRALSLSRLERSAAMAGSVASSSSMLPEAGSSESGSGESASPPASPSSPGLQYVQERGSGGGAQEVEVRS